MEKEEVEEEKSPKGVKSQSKSRMSKTATVFNTSPSMATTNRYDKKMEDTTPAKRWPKIKDPPPKRESSAQRFYRDFVDQTQKGYKSGILDPEVKPVDLYELMQEMKDQFDFRQGDLYNKEHKVQFMCYLDNFGNTLGALLSHKHGIPVSCSLREKNFVKDRT